VPGTSQKRRPACDRGRRATNYVDFASEAKCLNGEEYLKPAPDDLLQKWPDHKVNSSKAPPDDPGLIDKIAA
jgi:hypothetical protein